MAKVLVIEDDVDEVELIRFQLEQAGHNVFTATTGVEGLRQAYACRPDVILLDVMMPDMDGWKVCERLRQLTDVPIIFISALDREQHVVRGLMLGADDYIGKPYNVREMLARVAAVLRRQTMQGFTGDNVYVYQDLEIDFGRRVVKREGKSISLSPLEFKLLACLGKKPGKNLSHQYLIRAVWGPNRHSRSALKLYIWYLRQKLERDPSHPKVILTERGVGYRLSPPQE